MEIQEDRWLSDIFGYGVFKIDPSTDDRAPSLLNGLVSRHVRQRSEAMYYAKVDAGNVNAVRHLGEEGFYVVDVQVTFGREAKDPALISANPVEVTIEEFRPEHRGAILEIASSCFRFSRFHLDPGIPEAIANQIKRDWVSSYIQKQRGECLFVAVCDQQPVGFLAVLSSKTEGRRIRTIDLIGVAKDFQNRGIGRALVAFFINRYRDQSDFLQVGTQIANRPSIRLYQKAGFSLTKAQYVMHLHVQHGAIVGSQCKSASLT